MIDNKKIKYEAPTIEVMIVELEQGIAAASVTLSGGDPATPNQPQVDDWQDGGFGQQNGDL
jgi:organic radical activating enzyme